jgi:hypothetical protein
MTEDVRDTFEALEAVEAEIATLKRWRRRVSWIAAALSLTAVSAALPGGILYALSWGGGIAAAFSVRSWSWRRKLRELEQEQSRLLGPGGGGPP